MSDSINHNGVVDFVSDKNGRFSFKLSDGEWYGCWKTHPGCSKGDEVEFTYKLNDKGFRNVDAGSVNILGSTAPATQPAQSAADAAPTGTYTPSRTNNVYDVPSYWKAKFDHDVLETAPSIRNQAARKAAIETIGLALAQGIIELPATKKKGAQLEALTIFINELTVEYADETVNYVDSLGADVEQEQEDNDGQ